MCTLELRPPLRWMDESQKLKRLEWLMMQWKLVRQLYYCFETTRLTSLSWT